MKGAIFILALASFVSALVVVDAAQRDRDLTRQISDHRNHIQKLDANYAELQLEEGALAAQGRIQRLAESKLDMHPPKHDQIKVVFR